MPRIRLFGYSLTALLAGSLLTGICDSASGQQPSITRGATVRVSRPDSTGQSVWFTGRVVYAAADRLLLAETEADPLVRLNEAVRLQVRRSHSKSLLGGGVGFGIGALAGWRIGVSADGRSSASAQSIAGALLGGVVGAGLGAFLGSRIRSTSWEDVALEGGRISSGSPEETRTSTNIPLIGTYRWTRFDPTAANFQAFFERHSRSLDPVEGIWAASVGRAAVAIVRVGGPDEEKYAAFSIVVPEGRTVRRDDGIMLFALQQRADEENWFVQYPGGSPRRLRAMVYEFLLELEYADGLWHYWDKLYPD